MRMRNLLLSLFLGAPLAAQVLEPSQIGVQARLSVPLGSLSDALGGVRIPGVGGSLLAEFDLGDSLHLRGALGFDRWMEGGAALTGEDREIQVAHLGLEGLWFLRDDGALKAKGPYLLAGLGANYWSLGSSISGTPRRPIHVAGTVGLGWRLNEHLDGEVKVLVGAVEPGLTALAVMGGVTYRF